MRAQLRSTRAQKRVSLSFGLAMASRLVRDRDMCHAGPRTRLMMTTAARAARRTKSNGAKDEEPDEVKQRARRPRHQTCHVIIHEILRRRDQQIETHPAAGNESRGVMRLTPPSKNHVPNKDPFGGLPFQHRAEASGPCRSPAMLTSRTRRRWTMRCSPIIGRSDVRPTDCYLWPNSTGQHAASNGGRGRHSCARVPASSLTSASRSTREREARNAGPGRRLKMTAAGPRSRVKSNDGDKKTDEIEQRARRPCHQTCRVPIHERAPVQRSF